MYATPAGNGRRRGVGLGQDEIPVGVFVGQGTSAGKIPKTKPVGGAFLPPPKPPQPTIEYFSGGAGSQPHTAEEFGKNIYPQQPPAPTDQGAPPPIAPPVVQSDGGIIFERERPPEPLPFGGGGGPPPMLEPDAQSTRIPAALLALLAAFFVS